MKKERSIYTKTDLQAMTRSELESLVLKLQNITAHSSLNQHDRAGTTGVHEYSIAEESLLERTEWLTALMNHNPSLIFLKDEQGRYVYLNNSYEQQFTTKDWYGKTDFDFWPEDSAELFRRHDQKVIGSGQMQQFLEDSTDTEGRRYCWLCYKFPFTDSNGKVFLGGIGIDVTERVIAEEALRVSEERYMIINDLAPFAIGLMKFPEVTYEQVNVAFERMFGLSREEIIGKTSNELGISLDPEGRARMFSEVLERGSAHDWELAYATRSGEKRVGTFSFNLIEIGGQKYMLGTGLDITERKQIEIQLKTVNSELSAANKELESFSYSVSHDLRSPLHSINCFSYLLQEEHAHNLGEDGVLILSRIREATNKMASIIEDLLNLAKISRESMDFREMDLNPIVSSIISDLRQSEPQRSVTINITDAMHAFADMRLMRLALSNLIGNAWKYTGGNPVAHIEIGVTPGENEDVFYVHDNGAGFDMKFAHRLFQPFQRLHPESQFPGTGIGLAIVNRIIQRHNGRIWAESEVGVGTTFYFTLSDKR